MITIIADAMNSADDAIVKVGGRERRMDDVKEQLLQLRSYWICIGIFAV